MHKASDVLIHEFRNGAIGRISLETPEHRLKSNENAATEIVHD